MIFILMEVLLILPTISFTYNDPNVIGIRTLSTEKYDLDCFEDYCNVYLNPSFS